MKISGFTIARNVLKYNYPILESIRSILPICDEFVINVGDSDDDTFNYLKTLNSNKIRFIHSTWDMSQKAEVLSHQTNLALKACVGDWAFYLQSDEVVHEAHLPRLKRLMQQAWKNKDVDGLRFKWLHFYGSYWRYRVDYGWYQKQDRIIRNDGSVESCGDAFGFRRTNGQPLRRLDTGCFIYHYGWVQPEEVMAQRRRNAQEIGFITLKESEKKPAYDYGDLNRFPAYMGTHPAVMDKLVAKHSLSQGDWADISRRYWWHPARILRLRYKTFKRNKNRID